MVDGSSVSLAAARSGGICRNVTWARVFGEDKSQLGDRCRCYSCYTASYEVGRGRIFENEGSVSS